MTTLPVKHQPSGKILSLFRNSMFPPLNQLEGRPLFLFSPFFMFCTSGMDLRNAGKEKRVLRPKTPCVFGVLLCKDPVTISLHAPRYGLPYPSLFQKSRLQIDMIRPAARVRFRSLMKSFPPASDRRKLIRAAQPCPFSSDSALRRFCSAPPLPPLFGSRSALSVCFGARVRRAPQT